MTKWYIYKKKNNYFNNLKISGITKLQALILGNRDIIDPKLVESFIRPSLDDLNDPFLLPDMAKAVDLIIDAFEAEDEIRIFGDYDQDGIASVMTLLDGLLYFHDRVSYDLPDRVEEGYGISDKMADKAIADGVKLVITCDNGITGFSQVKKLEEAGIRVILTDHHQVKKEEEGDRVKDLLPEASCVINPKRADNKYPFDDLCGAGVAFKLIQAIFTSLGGESEYLYGLLEYVAMGTVCDIVSLTGENRIFVIEGLKRINQTEKLAIKALLEKNARNKEVTAYTLGFVIGPCMNATGRLENAKVAIDMLMEEDIDKIYEDAGHLVDLNNQRKDLTQEGLDACLDLIDEKNYSEDKVIVVFSERVQESIAGIVAGRIKDKFNRPTIVLARSSQEGVLKGSGRSIEAYNLHDQVDKYSENLISFGGHPMACGLSIREDLVDDFRDFLNENSPLEDEDFERVLNIDARIDISKLTLEFAESLKALEPYGKDNPRPIFADKNLCIDSLEMIGKDKNTMRIVFAKGGRKVPAIKFKAGDDYEYLSEKFKGEIIGKRIDIVYFPDINEFRGNKSLQLKIIDLR